MHPTPGLLIFGTLVILSVILSTAAVTRSGHGPSFSSFSSQFFSPPHPPATTVNASTRPGQSQFRLPEDIPSSEKEEASPIPFAEIQGATTTTTGTGPAAAVDDDDDDDDDDDGEYKYFREPGYTLELSHYDERYFGGALAGPARRAALRRLVRSYLNATAALGLETWLAHGTLLGWWWNGRIMPWDYDLDVQVGGRTLARMARELNGTVHAYRYWDEEEEEGREEEGGGGEEEEGEDDDDDDEQGRKRRGGRQKEGHYLLDVNPHWSSLGRGRGLNVIDARWIDVSTGMYVDITGLMERDPDRAPGVVSCKNFHAYRVGDLYPLRETEFEGVPALVPFEFENILMGEYGAKSLVTTEWAGHRWDEEKGEWVKMEELEGEEVIQG